MLKRIHSTNATLCVWNMLENKTIKFNTFRSLSFSPPSSSATSHILLFSIKSIFEYLQIWAKMSACLETLLSIFFFFFISFFFFVSLSFLPFLSLSHFLCLSFLSGSLHYTPWYSICDYLTEPKIFHVLTRNQFHDQFWRKSSRGERELSIRIRKVRQMSESIQ